MARWIGGLYGLIDMGGWMDGWMDGWIIDVERFRGMTFSEQESWIAAQKRGNWQ